MSWFFKRAESASVVVVDIRSSSVSVGYVLLKQNTAPHMVYTVRSPIDPHATEPLTDAMVRTLTTSLEILTKKGSSALLTQAGSAKIDKVLVTLTSPWQKSHIQRLVKTESKDFIFTHSVLDSLSDATNTKQEGRIRVSELLITTFLNGYETSNPFGKEVKSVEVLTLTTDIETELCDTVKKIVRSAFHQSHIDMYAFMPELYAVTRDLLPLQRDYLVLDVGMYSLDLLLVKHGLLVELPSSEHGVSDILKSIHANGVQTTEPEVHVHDSMLDTNRNESLATSAQDAKTQWIQSLKVTLATVAKEEPLPRMVLLLSEHNTSEFLQRLLDAPELHSLWLSDDSLSVFTIGTAQFSNYVSVSEGCEPPIPLYYLACAANKRYAP